MSRFSGWTMADVQRLTGEKLENYSQQNVVVKTRRRSSKNIPDYVGMISGALTMLGIEHEREYKFLHDRRFRFDIAIPKHMLAIEFEGGIYSNGAHTRGKHYSSDAKKYNLAAMHGWKLLRHTTDDTKHPNWEYRIAAQIKDFISKV